MSPDSPTTTLALRPAPGREKPLPEWVSTTDRNALPNVLNWSSESARPPINGLVDVTQFGLTLGTATVVGYYHYAGELGCWVLLDSPALHLEPANRLLNCFGEDLRRLDQGDEADTAEDSASVLDVTFIQPVEERTAEAPTTLPVMAESPATVPVTAESTAAEESNDTHSVTAPNNTHSVEDEQIGLS